MPRYFTHYWRNDTARNTSSLEGEPLDHTAGNEFAARGVEPGDFVYVVTNIEGQLYILSKLEVARVCDLEEAAAELKEDPKDLWDASDHIIARAATPMKFDLRIPIEVTQKLQFISGNKTKPLVFKSEGYLDNQTLRGFRELASVSAAEIDKFLPALLQISRQTEHETVFQDTLLPEELPASERYYEGTAKPITVNAYERNSAARKACIQHHGWNCFVCGFNFEAAYGSVGHNYIHVHHIIPLSQIGSRYELDPIRDLCPVCPNCHAMLHVKQPPYTVEELKSKLQL